MKLHHRYAPCFGGRRTRRCLLGEAVDLDAEHRKVILDSGELEYDTLIVATGSSDSYFGHDDWKRRRSGSEID